MASEQNHQTRVYRYALRGDLPESALRELRRAHELTNRMVEIERDHEERIKEVWRRAPSLLALEQQAIAQDEDVQTVFAEEPHDPPQPRAAEAAEGSAEEASRDPQRDPRGKGPDLPDPET